jgi:hypothetical protein
MFVELWFLNRSLSLPGASEPEPMRDNPICQSMLREVQSSHPLRLGQILDDAAFGPGHRRLFRSPSGEPEGPWVPLLRFEF